MVPEAPSVAKLIRTATATRQNVAHEFGRSEFLHSLDPKRTSPPSLASGHIDFEYRLQPIFVVPLLADLDEAVLSDEDA